MAIKKITWDEGQTDASGWREPDYISIHHIFHIEWTPGCPEAQFGDAEYYGTIWLNKEDILEIINVLDRLAALMPNNY